MTEIGCDICGRVYLTGVVSMSLKERIERAEKIGWKFKGEDTICPKCFQGE